MEETTATEHEIMDEDRAIMQILWANRHNEPNLCVHVTPKDVEALDQCLEYNKQAPVVKMIKTPTGWTIVLVDQDGNAVTPIENNEDDLVLAQQARKRQSVKDGIGSLANRIKNAAAIGEFSSSEIEELADAALLLAK